MRGVQAFRIHGGNIVECERTLALILEALGIGTCSIRGPVGSPVCPQFTLDYGAPAQRFNFTFLPGYGRWNQDILAHVRNRGGRLRETADAILTRVSDGQETPILALDPLTHGCL